MGRGFAVGIDVGGTRTKAGLVDLSRGAVMGIDIAPTETRDGGLFLASLKDSCDRLLQTAGLDYSQMDGIGVGVPGFTSGGVVESTWGFLTFMEDYPLQTNMEGLFPLPCRVDNDARLVALGEALYGAAAGASRSITLTLGTGVGFGLVVDGGFVTKAPIDHMAGHVAVRRGGPECYCGQRGCLETLVSATGLCLAMKAAAGGDWTGEAVLAAAARGDTTAQGVVEQFLDNLAVGLNSYVWMHAPNVIVLAGGLSGGLGRHLSRLQRQITAAPFRACHPQLRLSRLREEAGILGSAALFAAMPPCAEF